MLFVNETVIIGYVNIPNTVNATNTTARYLVTWQFNVSTRDSGVLATKDFTIKSNAKPIIQTIRTPSTGIFYLNTTPNFTLIGQNFQADSATGQKMTFLNVTNNVPPYNVTTTILAVNSTTIIGYVNISSDLPVSATGHLWVFNVSTKDGGLNTVGSTQKTITVSQRPAPTLASLNVTSANRNNTIPLKLTGTNFYPADGVRDGFTNVSLVHNFNGNTLYLAISSISADGKTIDGTITLPRDATSGALRCRCNNGRWRNRNQGKCIHHQLLTGTLQPED